jgi:cytochrome c551/c552
MIATSAFSQNGKNLFKANCTACHTIGQGHLVGPDLKGVTTRRNGDWLMKWIKSSQSLVKSKDPLAVALYNQNNQIIMPDQPFSDDQIKVLLNYIKTGNGADFVVNVSKDSDKKQGQDSSANGTATSNNNSSGNGNSVVDNKVATSPTAIKSTNESSQPDNKTTQSETATVSKNEAKVDDSKATNPDRIFLIIIISIGMLFFLGILVSMVMVIITLTAALGRKYEKELSE